MFLLVHSVLIRSNTV